MTWRPHHHIHHQYITSTVSVRVIHRVLCGFFCWLGHFETWYIDSFNQTLAITPRQRFWYVMITGVRAVRQVGQGCVLFCCWCYGEIKIQTCVCYCGTPLLQVPQHVTLDSSNLSRCGSTWLIRSLDLVTRYQEWICPRWLWSDLSPHI